FDIDYVDIDGDRAMLESIKGKRIGRLVVHIHRPDDADYVASCKSVDRLEIWGWKGPDLTVLQGLAITYLRLVRGNPRRKAPPGCLGETSRGRPDQQCSICPRDVTFADSCVVTS